MNMANHHQPPNHQIWVLKRQICNKNIINTSSKEDVGCSNKKMSSKAQDEEV
jgi:hypothetical protein